MVGRSFSGAQKDVYSKSDSARRVAMAADGLQLFALTVSKDELGCGWARHTINMRPASHIGKDNSDTELGTFWYPCDFSWSVPMRDG